MSIPTLEKIPDRNASLEKETLLSIAKPRIIPEMAAVPQIVRLEITGW
ncbi:MAG: hypothetical protein ABSE39_13430 [Candidatus Bathyarchaeia archaeon]